MCHWLVPPVTTILHNWLLGRISLLSIGAAYCYRQSSVVCLSVGLSVTTLRCAKVAEPIEMQFEMWTLVGLRNQVWPMLDGRSRSPHAKGKRYLYGKWLTERARTTVLLQRNRASEKRRTKCISVAGNCVEKWQNNYDVQILWLAHAGS